MALVSQKKKISNKHSRYYYFKVTIRKDTARPIETLDSGMNLVIAASEIAKLSKKKILTTKL